MNKRAKLYFWRGAVYIFAILAMGAFGFIACQDATTNQVVPTATPTQQLVSTATPTGEPSVVSAPEEISYTHDKYKVTVNYPSGWNGPEVFEYDGGFILEVGTDTVYPSGTNRADLIYTEENSYFITFEYRQKTEDVATEEYIENSPWLQQYLSVMALEDGESISDMRSLQIRVRQVEIDGFSGVEIISTLSDTAQTEMGYIREAFLLNDSYDSITIVGSPNNVAVDDKENWKAAYQEVDQEYLDTFRRFVNSVSFAE